ncbi:MAG: type IV toxin-antitoxin system AbiEi family antitoxin [Anaerolineaceae bacterium]
MIETLGFQCYNGFQQTLKGCVLLKDKEILLQGMLLLQNSLSGVPFFKNAIVGKHSISETSSIADMTYSIPGLDFQFMLKAKSSGQPRYAKDAVNELLLIQNNNPERYGILVAPFISSEAAKICEDANIGYLDLSGNCRLAFKNIFIEKVCQPNKFSVKRELVSLYSPKSERILRVLLTYPYQPWRTVELAQKAKVSIGLISYVKKQLGDREWIHISEEGFALIQPEALIEEWSKNYSFKKNEISDCYTLSSPVDLENTIKNFSSANSEITYALTGFSAANYYAPMVRNQRSMIYLSDVNDFVIQQLNLKPVTSGANVSLLKPYDNGVFLDLQEVNGVLAVSPIQAYLDLKNYRGRGEEAADAIYKEIIQKQWSMQKITMP